MTRNRFSQAKQSAITSSLSIIKARQLFLEDNDYIAMKYTCKITNVYPPTDEKDVASKEYCEVTC